MIISIITTVRFDRCYYACGSYNILHQYIRIGFDFRLDVFWTFWRMFWHRRR